MLTFVFMESLDLHIEKCGGIYRDAAVSFDDASRSTLFACLMFMKSIWNCKSSANSSRARSLSRSRSQPSPILEVIRPLRRGLHAKSQRRGVIPLVLLLNLPG